MVSTKYEFLKLISFHSIETWSSKRIFSLHQTHFKYDLHRISEVIERKKDVTIVEDDKRYKRITIKTNCGGVIVRDTEAGISIKTKKQFFVSPGQLAISKIDARNGAFGIVPPEAENAIITENFWAYNVNAVRANISYLVMVLSSQQFVQAWLECSNGSGNRLYLQENLFLQYKIPLPSISIQNALVNQYNVTILEAEKNEKEADALVENIDKVLLNELSIKKTIYQDTTNHILHFSAFRKLYNWGAELNLKAVSPKDLFTSEKYSNVRLSSVAEINPQTKYPSDIEKSGITFLPMKCISDIYGEIASYQKRSASEAKGYTRFKENDLLWAKITPCMQNGKCAIAQNLVSGFGYGSTEYHVIRVNSKKVLVEYVYCFLRTKIIRKVAQSYFSGSAGQQRVSAEVLENLTIPLPRIKSPDPNELTQEVIVKKIFAIKKQIKAHREKAADLRKHAKKEFEEAVFGE